LFSPKRPIIFNQVHHRKYIGQEETMRMKFLILVVVMLAIASLNLSLVSTLAQNKGKPIEGKRRSEKEQRVLGNISGDRKEVVDAPETVRAGEDFKVTINTFGSGCEREGDTGVIVSESSATIMVYDFTSATHPGVICTMIAKRMPHVVTLRFTKPGEATIRIWGRRFEKDAPPLEGAPTVLEHRVTVK
jgi:hypothetical protein